MTLITSLLLVFHVVLTGAMTGIMWFVQLAYYPNLQFVGDGQYEHYEREHLRRISRPAWCFLAVELLTAVSALCCSPPEIRWALGTNLLLLLVIWSSTYFIQVPLHRLLADRFEASTHRRLVVSNWLRTASYTMRALLLTVVLSGIFAHSLFEDDEPRRSLQVADQLGQAGKQ
ncbi:MAG: hypothetical protein ACR2NZ_10245 [Rubripirellula sp.]